MKKAKLAYTADYKELAVKRVKGGQSIRAFNEEFRLGARLCVTGSKRQQRARLGRGRRKRGGPEEMELSRQMQRACDSNGRMKSIKIDGEFCKRCSVKNVPQIIVLGMLGVLVKGGAKSNSRKNW